MLLNSIDSALLKETQSKTFEFYRLSGRYIWEQMKYKIGNYRWRQCKKAQKICNTPKIDVIKFNIDSKELNKVYGV